MNTPLDEGYIIANGVHYRTKRIKSMYLDVLQNVMDKTGWTTSIPFHTYKEINNENS